MKYKFLNRSFQLYVLCYYARKYGDCGSHKEETKRFTEIPLLQGSLGLKMHVHDDLNPSDIDIDSYLVANVNKAILIMQGYI